MPLKKRFANMDWPTFNTDSWPAWPEQDEQTWQQVKTVMQSGRWAISGPFAGQQSCEQRFAERFAKYNNIAHCVTLDHGTSALVAALEALDVGVGDEVIVPGFTWVAPAIAVLSVNALPVLVDIEPDTFCMSPASVEAAISDKTKAIIAVHMYGCMADMPALQEIAKRHDLKLIEDAAHQHGAQWSGQKAGTFGDVGVFSLQQGKVLTAGEGGAAITHDADIKRRIENSAWNARRLLPPDNCKVGDMQLCTGDHRFATNRCISEIQAAIALDQLERLDEQNIRRHNAASWLNDAIDTLPGFQPMRVREQVDLPVYYGYVVRIDAEFIAMSTANIVDALQNMLAMGDFLVHKPYPAMNNNPLYALHPQRHKLASYDSFADMPRLPNAQAAAEYSVVFHHSVLLAENKQLHNIVDALSCISNM